jgi:hypothetical protein
VRSAIQKSNNELGILFSWEKKKEIPEVVGFGDLEHLGAR